MAVEVVAGTPLADALQNVVQPKLVEAGWSTGGLDDSALSEYIILMLVNGKTQEEIASELSTDLLGLGPDDQGAKEFSMWLFGQVESLSAQMDEGVAVKIEAPQGSVPVSHEHIKTETSTQPGTVRQDAEMRDSADSTQSGVVYVSQKARCHYFTQLANLDTKSPTGPKSMRNPAPNVREKRMFGQLNRAMDRSSDVTLHRVRGAAGTGRINTHAREPPKGPRNMVNRAQPVLQGRPPMGGPITNRPMGSMALPDMAASNPMMMMTPQQQMQLFKMYEEQARMMTQILSPQQAQQIFSAQGVAAPMVNPALQNGGQQAGKSLDRIENKPQRQYGGYKGKSQGGDLRRGSADMDTRAEGPTTSMEVDSSHAHKDPFETLCIYNLNCTKADCPFAHQSPAAPPGTTVDFTDTCSYGVACQNRKCVGRHPSPAKRSSHQAEQECRFYPNCTNPKCPFKHPDMPPCRNGADCTVPNCKFVHSKILCRYNPCLNAICPYKHTEGQRRGAFQDKVWKADGGKSEDHHVSERKFVDDDGEEELILPGAGSQHGGSQTSLAAGDIIT
ncbi:hypothetical protein LTR04_000346 [Oleoguttula sp. CCFEE 6159]|nr:hypothetical protein LTR04_000346 [Oleoguttula sp. CCFEE 6159]